MQNYTPLDISPQIPSPKKSLKSTSRRSMFALLSSFILFVGLISGYFLVSNGVIFQNQAWETTQTAVSKCNAEGTIDIEVKFTNTEPNQPWQAMDVKVKDLQTGTQADLGTVQPGGQSKSATLKTGKSQLAAGNVLFSLEWTQETRTDVDTRTAGYNAAGPCTTPTPTVTPTKTPTPTPTPVPQCGSSCTTNANCPSTTVCSAGKCVLNRCLEAGAVCSTDKCTYYEPTPTPSPTPTSCPVPGQIKNIKVTCPNCEGQ